MSRLIDSQKFLLSPGRHWDQIALNAQQFIAGLDKDKPWHVEIKRHRNSRTDRQNRYLFGVVYEIILEHNGGGSEKEKQQLHEDFLCDYFGAEERYVLGVRMRVPKRRSSGLPWDEFWNFVEYVRREAGEYGIHIPDPDPYWRAAMEMEKRA